VNEIGRKYRFVLVVTMVVLHGPTRNGRPLRVSAKELNTIPANPIWGGKGWGTTRCAAAIRIAKAAAGRT
jgi:hypothetical protein